VKYPCNVTGYFLSIENDLFSNYQRIINTIHQYKNSTFDLQTLVKSRLLCKMLYNVFTISTYQN
ncbi:DUF6038 family protein, partial [Staphylococcus aureus]|uniref:DUF6038 family protein n=1 Tax=Staphylococcus aureus TaxID=1280 RepID=UPI003211B435